MRDIREKVRDLMANKKGDKTGAKEMALEERDLTITETAGETEMGTAATNDWSNSPQLCRDVHVANSGAENRGGIKGRCSVH
jgi:hypothetical protein